jgi:hypothetical protein
MQSYLSPMRSGMGGAFASPFATRVAATSPSLGAPAPSPAAVSAADTAIDARVLALPAVRPIHTFASSPMGAREKATESAYGAVPGFKTFAELAAPPTSTAAASQPVAASPGVKPTFSTFDALARGRLAAQTLDCPNCAHVHGHEHSPEHPHSHTRHGSSGARGSSRWTSAGGRNPAPRPSSASLQSSKLDCDCHTHDKDWELVPGEMHRPHTHTPAPVPSAEPAPEAEVETAVAPEEEEFSATFAVAAAQGRAGTTSALLHLPSGAVLAGDAAIDAAALKFDAKIGDVGRRLFGGAGDAIMLHAYSEADRLGHEGISEATFALVKPMFNEFRDGKYDTAREEFSAFTTSRYEALPVPESEARRAKATEIIEMTNAAHKVFSSSVRRVGKRYKVVEPDALAGMVVVHLGNLGSGGKGLAIKKDFFAKSKGAKGLLKGQKASLRFRNITNDKREQLLIGSRLEASGTASWLLQTRLWYITLPANHKSGLAYVLLLFEDKRGDEALRASLTDVFFVYTKEAAQRSARVLMGAELAFAKRVCSLVAQGVVATALDGKQGSGTAAGADAMREALAQLGTLLGAPALDLSQERGVRDAQALGVYLGALTAEIRLDAAENDIDLGNVPASIKSAVAAVGVKVAASERAAADLGSCIATLGDELAEAQFTREELAERATLLYEHMLDSLAFSASEFWDDNLEGIDREVAERTNHELLGISLIGFSHAIGRVMGAHTLGEHFNALWAQPAAALTTDAVLGIFNA